MMSKKILRLGAAINLSSLSDITHTHTQKTASQTTHSMSSLLTHNHPRPFLFFFTFFTLLISQKSKILSYLSLSLTSHTHTHTQKQKQKQQHTAAHSMSPHTTSVSFRFFTLLISQNTKKLSSPSLTSDITHTLHTHTHKNKNNTQQHTASLLTQRPFLFASSHF